MRYGAKRRGDSEMVTASEIACYAYCPEQYRLQYALGLPVQNGASLEAGTLHHEKKAAGERIAGGALALGRALAILAVVVLLLLWVFFR